MSQPAGNLNGSLCSSLAGLLTFADPNPEPFWYMFSAGGVKTEEYDVYAPDIVGIEEVAWLWLIVWSSPGGVKEGLETEERL